MRLTTVNPLPYAPRTSIERELCDRVRVLSGEVVLHVWTPDSYPYDDAEGKRVLLEADYEIRTGRLSNGLFVGGSVYRAMVRESQIEVEFFGSYI